MSKIIELAATIEEGQISLVHSFAGKANISPCCIDGVPYAAGACVFMGFAGRIDMTDGLYRGVYRLDVEPPEDAERASFVGIPNLVLPHSATVGPPATTVVVDGVSSEESENSDEL